MKRRGKSYRKVYPYQCTNCGKHRIAFLFARASGKLCSKCEPKVVPENQLALSI